MTTLTGTVQVTQTVYRPLKYNENATSATQLQTARLINGTSFNGTADITTANWGTARTLTIGNTGKSVNGSGNVAWSLAEIGALPLTGGTLSGALNFANGTWNNVGDDVAIGDYNVAGMLGIKGLNREYSGIAFYTPSNVSIGQLKAESNVLKFNDYTIYHSGNLTNLNQLSTRNFSDLQNKPITLSGYGITDAPTKTGVGASGT
jgi:hypothetical protein